MQTGTISEATSPATLYGRRVAVARAAEEVHTPAKPLLALGAELVYYPCFETQPPDNLAEFDDELKRLSGGEYDWLFLTTASVVIILADRLSQLKFEPAVLNKTHVALFGSNARRAAEDLLELDVDKLPDAPSDVELLDALPLRSGEKVLFPVSAGVRAGWLRTLQERNIQVNTVAAYRTLICHGGDKLPEMLWSGAVDAITFTSENNVEYFARRLHYEGGSLDMLDDVCVACIGPRTAAAARDRGLRVRIEPRQHTPEGLAAELAAYFARRDR